MNGSSNAPANPQTVRQTLMNARLAIQRGDRQAARRWAERAVSLVPDLEEAWLIMAAVASPRASIIYLERALEINPASQPARQAMHQAVQRLRRERTEAPSLSDTQPGRLRSAGGPRQTSGPLRRPVRGGVAGSAPPVPPLGRKSLAKYRWSVLAVTLLAVCLTVGWAFWPGNASRAMTALGVPPGAQHTLGAAVGVEKPTYTPTFTNTYTPTETFTPTPTETLTPSLTWTPWPTVTPLPTATPWPTDTEVPWPTDAPPAYADSGGGERWIDVNLSEQMVYAYEGNTIVASFLVSTGVPQFPTVTGSYRIYVKYLYTDMSGPGYYLPDVPYTMYFYRGYSLHGTYWHNNFGHPMSHGCINMYTPDAEWMFYWASVGTLVSIHY
jgi:lipoprotein-anchoring transpeptidase ErfK/SrfK